MIDNVRNLNKIGNYNGALKALEGIENKDRYHYCEAAKSYLALKDYNAALTSIDKVISLKQDWVGAYGIKVSVLYNQKQFDFIVPTLIDMINHSEKLTDRESSYHLVFNTILDYNIPGVLILIDSLLEYYKYRLGEDDFYNFYKGIVNANTKKMELASDNFNKITNVEKFGVRSTGAASFSYGASLTEVLVGNYSESLPVIYFSKKNVSRSNFETVLLASCDDGYFNIFIDLIIASFSKELTRKLLHIHLINPVSSTLDRCLELSGKHDFFNFSYEANPGAQKLEFACSRFVRLEEFLNFYKKDIVVCDMDSCFVSDFDARALLGEDDVAIKSDHSCALHYYPWRQLIASFVIFKYSDPTIKLANDLKKFLMHFIQKNDQNYWFVDQTALFCLLDHHYSNHELRYNSIERTSNMVLVPDARSESKEDFVKRMIKSLHPDASH